MHKYLEGHDLSEADIKAGLRTRVIKNEIVPMLCGSAFKNKGVQAMLDAVIDTCPRRDIPPVTGEAEDGKIVSRKADDSEPFAALAFKIMTDPYVGQLTFIRVYSGVLKSGDTVYNSVRGRKERIGRLLQMHANQREEIKEVFAGDIAAAVGLKEASTGETLCHPNKVITPSAWCSPSRSFPRLVEPKTKADQEKMGIASTAWRRKILRSASTPTRNPADHHLGDGRVHLEIIVDRMKRGLVSRPTSASRRSLTAKPSRSREVEASSSSSPAAAASTATSGSS